MEPLTPSDVKRWDLNAIRGVFETASSRADTLQRLGDNLQQVHTNLSDWQGEAGEAFRADLGNTRRDIEADGAESRRVAAAVQHAEADVSACKAELADIERAADANGWTITPDWRIDVGDTGIGRDPLGFAAEQQALQDALNALKVHAHNADHELATAIRAAVGEVQLDATGNPPGGAPARPGAPNPPGGGEPRSLEEMLLPAGPAGAEPRGAPPQGPPVPAGAGSGGAGGKPPSLEDLLLGRGQPSGRGGQLPPPGSLPDLLSRLRQPGVPGGAPAPRLNPADVESAKAMIRQSMLLDGVPPDQIEARLDAAVAGAQQWIDNGMPNYVPPEPQRPPPQGLAEGFGDRWWATEQRIKNLIGQGGPGAPGVLESWEGLLKSTTETVQNPMGAVIGEAKNAWDSPSAAYYLGGKLSDGAFALPGLLFGGEGAGVGELADLDAAAYGPVHSPHAPIGFDDPAAYHSWAEDAAQDLNVAHWHGEPTATLSQKLAEMATHHIGDNPDRVVLGKFGGQEGGYIGDARGHGGIYFDTGDPTWDALTGGLSSGEERSLVWPVNEQFLRSQMENHVGRIDYMLDHDEYSSLEDMAEDRANSYSALEINFLNENAAAYGYQRVGDSWVYVKGGQR